MKIKIDVKDKDEAASIRRALADKETRALVLTVGYILGVETYRARRRVLNFVADSLDEQISVAP